MPFESLHGRRFVLLTTYRRDGTPVPTPVWAVFHDGRAYVVSRGPGKVRRIRVDPTVQLAPSTARGRARGPAVGGRARVVEGGLPHPVRRQFGRRYGPLPLLGRTMARIFGKELVLLEISPESEGSGRNGQVPAGARVR